MRNRVFSLMLLCVLLFAACASVEIALPDSKPSPSAASAADSTVDIISIPDSAAPATQTPAAESGFPIENGVLRAVVDADDFAEIAQIPNLNTLDVSGSTCYEAIIAYKNAHPDVTVLYSVPIGETEIPSDARAAVVKSVPNPADLRYLPMLSELTVTEPMTVSKITDLQSAASGIALSYSAAFAGLTVSSAQTALDLSKTAPALSEQIAEGLAVLPNITDIELNRAAGSSEWTLEDAGILQTVRPSLRVSLNVTAFDRTFSLTDEVVDFNEIRMDTQTRKNELLALLPYLRSVKRLDMEGCWIPNEEMAALRARFSSPKIVWRVKVGRYSCRTDAKMIRFSKYDKDLKLTNGSARALMYCNEVRYLDLGHNKIENPDFVAYMPDLEVCIIAVNQTIDISAFANCTHLEYAELFSGRITDVSPLAACKELKHLNLCANRISDITPLYRLTGLKRLWISQNRIPEDQIAEFRNLMPDCVVNTTAEDPTQEGWRFDPARESGYSERYELLRRQFSYDDLQLTSSSALPDLD